MMFVCGELSIEIPCYLQNLLAHTYAVVTASITQPASEHPVMTNSTRQEKSRDLRD